MVRSAGLSSRRIIRLGSATEIEDAFSALIIEKNSGAELSEMMSNSCLIRLITLIGRRILYGCSINDLSSRNRIKDIMIRMFEDIREPKSISSYASECNLSVSRFSHLFKEMTGSTSTT